MSEKIVENSKSIYELFITLHTTSQALIRLIEKENKLLEQGQGSAISRLLDQKQELITKLQDLEEKIKSSEKVETSGELTNLIAKIKNAYIKLQTVMHDNEVLLKSKIIVSNKIIELYKNKHLEKALSQFGYNKDGVLPALKKLEKVMPSISLNNKI